ncbi:hypothetical protein [Microtetraspora fusca]|uniref:hypothetical protein n=1 Tax=Microtetraspora fusca TaxID=1997 RepID=UPI000A8AA463|nr:hypothetical protein [Microtetraspora fusca]
MLATVLFPIRLRCLATSAGRWTTVGVLAVTAAVGVGTLPVRADTGCAQVKGTAAQYIDAEKLCANMQQELRKWMQTGKQLDFGQALRNSVKGRAPLVITPQQQVVPALPTVAPPPVLVTVTPQPVAPQVLPAETSTPQPVKPTEASKPSPKQRQTRRARKPSAPDREVTSPDLTVIPVADESERLRRTASPARKAPTGRTRGVTQSRAAVAQTPPSRGAFSNTEPPPERPRPEAGEQETSSMLPLTVPAGVVALFLLGMTYRRRRQLAGNATKWWRRTRLTRDADRLIRLSAAAYEPSVVVRERGQAKHEKALGTERRIASFDGTVLHDGEADHEAIITVHVRSEEHGVVPWAETATEPTSGQGGTPGQILLEQPAPGFGGSQECEMTLVQEAVREHVVSRESSERPKPEQVLHVEEDDQAPHYEETPQLNALPGEGSASEEDIVDRDQEPSNLSYAIALSALYGMGLTGPGTDDVGRAMVLELLAVRDLTTRVLMARDDAIRLFGVYAAEVEVPGLVVLDSPEDVMTELEVEIVRRSGQRTDSGVPEGLSWLFVVASVGAARERLHRIVEGGMEDLILGVFLDPWPSGVTCTIDQNGRLTQLEGSSAPPWVGRRLALCDKDEAVRRLAGFTATT